MQLSDAPALTFGAGIGEKFLLLVTVAVYAASAKIIARTRFSFWNLEWEADSSGK